jgi:hypothetical protein
VYDTPRFDPLDMICAGRWAPGNAWKEQFDHPADYVLTGSGKQLFYHVRYRRTDAPDRGEGMPALKFMTEVDAARLWTWLKAIGSKPMAPYRPTP